MGRLQQGDKNGNHRHGHCVNGVSGEYNSWYGMLQRCTNPNRRYYHRYGGRGIKVCERWFSFANFIADMGPRPDKHSLDRVDNDGDYTPENCRWAPQSTQMRNTARTKTLCVNGIEKPLVEWAHELSVRPNVLRKRLMRGWSAAATVTTPIGSMKSNG